ncbi:MAG: hypothetical protein DI538_28155 [Azospira oryzae]|nr:MAG: hypothetical protein DI538_28155 [Azospira oryzae]
MTEQLIVQFIPERVSQLGFMDYHLRYRDIMIDKESSMNITAYNELYFIVDDPPDLVVESDYGIYDSTDSPVEENIHQHRGEILIQNKESKSRRIKFIQVIIVN